MLYPEDYEIETDDMNDSVFETLASNLPTLRDVHLGSFYAVTSATWMVWTLSLYSNFCPDYRNILLYSLFQHIVPDCDHLVWMTADYLLLKMIFTY